MKKKPGALDIIVILAVIAVAAVIVFYLSHNSVGDSAVGGGSYEISYTVEFKHNINKDAADNITPGDNVYNAESGAYIGEVESAEIVPLRIDGYDEATKSFVLREAEDKYALLLTVKAKADVTESATSVNGVNVMVGEELAIHTPTFGSEGFCIGLEEPDYDN